MDFVLFMVSSSFVLAGYSCPTMKLTIQNYLPLTYRIVDSLSQQLRMRGSAQADQQSH
jgi:hypothetical protein